MSTEAFLAKADRNYNSEICMLGTEWNGPGYHSKIPNGTWVHPTRNAIYYALFLLKTGDTANCDRAAKIIATVLTLQDKNPYSPTYGIWPWLHEESLQEMSPPDWNWADFIGAGLAHAVKEFSSSLPDDLCEEIKESLGHAAWSIFRRNVQPDYTNIAIMGTAVTAAAGELLNEPRLADYAFERIKRFVEYTEEQGGLNEYNSPCYTFVALHETERILQLVETSRIREYAEKLRYIIWECLATHFHPGTGQLAGPHSRTYGDKLFSSTYDYLEEATGLNFAAAAEAEAKAQLPEFVTPLPCPDDLKNHFARLPELEICRKDRFVKKESESKSLYGTTYMTESFCLGSINREFFWTQRRPLIAYWSTMSESAVVLRLRFMKNGKDFSSAGLYNVQDKARVLTGIKMFSNLGDYHPGLDVPKDGVFKAESLVLRYELTAQEAEVKQLDEHRYELKAGAEKAVIHALPGKFNGTPVEWRTGTADGQAYVEAICYEGPEKDFVFDESFTVELAAGLELLKDDESFTSELPEFKLSGNQAELNWNDMKLSYQASSEKFD